MKVKKRKLSSAWPRLGFTHAHKGGGAVLRGESSWRTINGVFINTKPTGCLMLVFRRDGKKLWAL